MAVHGDEFFGAVGLNFAGPDPQGVRDGAGAGEDFRRQVLMNGGVVFIDVQLFEEGHVAFAEQFAVELAGSGVLVGVHAVPAGGDELAEDFRGKEAGEIVAHADLARAGCSGRGAGG